MITALIVDDETPARAELRRFLQNEKEFQILGEAADGEAALEIIKRFKPNVVFLDIQMPKKNGLEVAASLSELENPPVVIFVTAFDEFAIQAFEVNALDYLLKPYEEERFKQACSKIKKSIERLYAEAKEKLSSLSGYMEKKPLKILGHKRNNKERIFIHDQEVLYFHVNLTEVTAHLQNGDELLINSNLKLLLEMLEPARFQQTHRAFIVNLDQVDKVSPLFAGNFNLILKDVKKTVVPLSRRYAKKLRTYLKW